MKRYALLSALLISTFSIHSQDLFETGLKYMETGQYSLADSVFGLYLTQYPNDLSGYFNYGSTKLLLGDTCAFCDIMYLVSHSFQDKQAEELYYVYCGSADTVYRDKNYLKCEKAKARYTEVIENHKCRDYKTVFVHDKRNKNGVILANPDITNLQSTDIIAVYLLFNDDSTLFTFTKTPPEYIGGLDVKRRYMENNPYVKEAKEKLNTSKLVVSIEYIVDKTGSRNNLKILRTNKPVSQMDILEKYIKLIFESLPRESPAQYQYQNVNYLERESISIW